MDSEEKFNELLIKHDLSVEDHIDKIPHLIEGFRPEDYHNLDEFLEYDKAEDGFDKMNSMKEGTMYYFGTEFGGIDVFDAETGVMLYDFVDNINLHVVSGLEYMRKSYIHVYKITEDRIYATCHGKMAKFYSKIALDKTSEGWKSCRRLDYVFAKTSCVARSFRKVKFALEALPYYEEYKKEVSDKFYKLLEIAESAYPGMVDGGLCSDYEPDPSNEGRDLLLESFGSKFGYILIRFPKVEVTNSKGLSHEITEMYILLTINAKGFIDSYRGCRMKAEAKELNISYAHSHLSSGLGRFSSFCTGRGDFSTLYQVLRHEYNEELFDVFLAYIKIYLEWESLAGGPFKKIEYAIRGTTGSNRGSIGEVRIREFFRCVKKFAPKDVLNSIEVTIDDLGDNQTIVTIYGGKKIAEWVKSIDEETFVEKEMHETIRFRYFHDCFVFVSAENRVLGSLSIAEAKRNMKDFNVRSTFMFKGDRIEFQKYLDETLYQESYDTPIVDLDPEVRLYMEGIMKRQLVFSMINEVQKTAKENDKYNEFKENNKHVPEEILACSTVY